MTKEKPKPEPLMWLDDIHAVRLSSIDTVRLINSGNKQYWYVWLSTKYNPQLELNHRFYTYAEAKAFVEYYFGPTEQHMSFT